MTCEWKYYPMSNRVFLCMAVRPGWFFSALCWWIQGCRFLAPEVWSRASAWKHQPSAPAAVWATRRPWLHHQKHRRVVFSHVEKQILLFFAVIFFLKWLITYVQTGEMTTGCWSMTVQWILLQTEWGFTHVHADTQPSSLCLCWVPLSSLP